MRHRDFDMNLLLCPRDTTLKLKCRPTGRKRLKVKELAKMTNHPCESGFAVTVKIASGNEIPLSLISFHDAGGAQAEQILISLDPVFASVFLLVPSLLLLIIISCLITCQVIIDY